VAAPKKRSSGAAAVAQGPARQTIALKGSSLTACLQVGAPRFIPK
jgi:hypothetical protein